MIYRLGQSSPLILPDKDTVPVAGVKGGVMGVLFCAWN